jgi:hypothetical protein
LILRNPGKHRNWNLFEKIFLSLKHSMFMTASNVYPLLHIFMKQISVSKSRLKDPPKSIIYCLIVSPSTHPIFISLTTRFEFLKVNEKFPSFLQNIVAKTMKRNFLHENNFSLPSTSNGYVSRRFPISSSQTEKDANSERVRVKKDKPQ